MLADSHCHLNFPDFTGDLENIIERARQAGVGYLNTIGTRLTEIDAILKLIEPYDHVVTTAGIHPHYAREAGANLAQELFNALNHPKMVAVGETGFDFHYNHSDKGDQERVFREHVRVAVARHLPLVVHTREAEADTRRVLEEERGEECGGVIHCFTGSREMAHWALDFGYYISFSGVVTFRTAEALRQVALSVPLDRLLLETDSPYLAPIPYRGKRNEPAYVVEVARMLAKVKGVTLEELAAITTRNYHHLFALQAQPAPKETLVYAIGRGLYVNLTRGCTLRCAFCPKWDKPVVHHYDLSLHRNPKAAEIIAALGDIASYDELVFCGFGEPTLRLPILLEVARWAKGHGCPRVRVNTDGLANLVHGRDVTPEFAGVVDAVSVSLNAQDAALYEQHCLPSLAGSYEAVKEFCRLVKRHVPDVQVTAIEGLAGVDIARCQTMAQEELGVRFRKRTLNALG
ncbi:MAG: YchF/TatD family DNA exonuclease [Magnetococcales bacterium]|nr:YchF/TatD family DNA exonuclease [Magnetococcales bacterium]